MAKKPSFEVNHDDKLIAVIHVDKLDQICDIKPHTEFTNSLLNTYRDVQLNWLSPRWRRK